MNNEQFRRLVSGTGKGGSPQNESSPSSGSPKTGSTLGSRQRSAIPMTPRSVGGAQANFARQMVERNQANRPQKTFKTSAPRGVKLGSGYVDRAKDRGDEEADDREERLKALEKSLKDEEIDQATYERLRFQIAGGDLSSTHLVKGLDFKLLKRIREGEDVYGQKQVESETAEEPSEVADDEFDKLETQTFKAVERPKEEKKKGQLSTVQLAPGRKRTRDQILAELKASRRAAKEQQESALGQGFKKIGAKQMPGTRIERDSKGREVMIIIDEDGHEKRKVRKVQPDEAKPELLMPDASAKPLGMEVPEQYRKRVEEPEEDEDDDIFADAGDDYDPLAGMVGSDADSDNEVTSDKDQAGSSRAAREDQMSAKDKEETAAMPPPPKPVSAAPRNYFSNAKTGLISEEAEKAPSMSDPAIMAAIKKAAALNPIGREGGDGSSDEDEQDKEKALQERRKRLLESSSRDDDDLDMGFGTSRFEDEEDFDDSKVKLSTWGDDGDGGQDRGGKAKRKRGPKKRKGDANNADDVLRVMEQRKKS